VDKNAEEFEIDHSEVVTVKWFSKEKLRKALKTNPEIFVGSFQGIDIKAQ
jgi:NADH pyrophosphatase NudC (nudix superfamily)